MGISVTGMIPCGDFQLFVENVFLSKNILTGHGGFAVSGGVGKWTAYDGKSVRPYWRKALLSDTNGLCMKKEKVVSRQPVSL